MRPLDNRVITRERLVGLNKGFLRDQEFFVIHLNIIRGYLSEGHAQIVPNEPLRKTMSQDGTYHITPSRTLKSQPS